MNLVFKRLVMIFKCGKYSFYFSLVFGVLMNLVICVYIFLEIVDFVKFECVELEVKICFVWFCIFGVIIEFLIFCVDGYGYGMNKVVYEWFGKIEVLYINEFVFMVYWVN